MKLLCWLGSRRLWAVATLAVAVVIAAGSLTPANEMPQTLLWDKFNHFAGYGGLALCAGLAGVRVGTAWWLVAGYGVLIELAQTSVPGRMGGDVADMLANALGAALTLGLLSVARRFAARSA